MHKWPVEARTASIHAAREQWREAMAQLILAAVLLFLAIVGMEVGIRVVDRTIPLQAEISAPSQSH